MTGQAGNAIAVIQVSSVESLESCCQVREQNVTAKVEGDCVIPNETAVPNIVDFDPPKVKFDQLNKFEASTSLINLITQW